MALFKMYLGTGMLVDFSRKNQQHLVEAIDPGGEGRVKI